MAGTLKYGCAKEGSGTAGHVCRQELAFDLCNPPRPVTSSRSEGGSAILPSL